MGAAVRSAEKAVGGGGALTCRGAALCCSPAFMFGTKCPKHKKHGSIMLPCSITANINTNYICAAFSTGNGGSGKLEINNSCPCVRTREAHV